MWQYEKKLQYPVNIKNPNPKYAKIIISQYGGPDGELGASMRYLTQRYGMPYNEVKGTLTDIGIEDLFCVFNNILKNQYNTPQPISRQNGTTQGSTTTTHYNPLQD